MSARLCASRKGDARQRRFDALLLLLLLVRMGVGGWASRITHTSTFLYNMSGMAADGRCHVKRLICLSSIKPEPARSVPSRAASLGVKSLD